MDEPGKWECRVFLEPRTPKDSCTVNITPRRLQKLQIRPGQRFQWVARPVKDGQPQSGAAAADKDALLTLEKVRVGKGGTRLTLTAE